MFKIFSLPRSARTTLFSLATGGFFQSAAYKLECTGAGCYGILPASMASITRDGSNINLSLNSSITLLNMITAKPISYFFNISYRDAIKFSAFGMAVLATCILAISDEVQPWKKTPIYTGPSFRIGGIT